MKEVLSLCIKMLALLHFVSGKSLRFDLFQEKLLYKFGIIIIFIKYRFLAILLLLLILQLNNLTLFFTYFKIL